MFGLLRGLLGFFFLLCDSLQAKRNPPSSGIDAEDFHFGQLPLAHDVAHAPDTLGGKFRDVDYPLYAGFEFHEGTEVRDAGDLARDTSAGFHTLGELLEGADRELLHRQANLARIEIDAIH